MSHPPAPSAATSAPSSPTHAFVARWAGVEASELASAQSFVLELCELLGLHTPLPTAAQDYMFERPVTFLHGDGSRSSGRIDCYKRGCFVLEAKKLKAARHTKGFDEGLLRARAQAEHYARALPAAEGRPPFLLVVDVGNVIELYAEFSRSGGTYTPFPDPRSHRLQLNDLLRPEVRDTLRAVWTAPDSLDPARRSAQVTRDVAAVLAQLSHELEQHYPADTVAAYLTRCLFSMFAEDVELLPKGAFLGLLQQHRRRPDVLQRMVAILWADMDKGGFCPALATDVLRFNGKLFKGAGGDGYSLLLNAAQIELLLQAAQANWREVEPAIFGTLLERALDPRERHALGAHYTPRAYVERLVWPTVIQPLRTQWGHAQAAALLLAQEAATLEAAPPAVHTKKDLAALDHHRAQVRDKWEQARQEVRRFHHRLCTLRVLDPACGSGNFLYVTLEHLKRLEGEVLNQLTSLGDAQEGLDLGAETVTLAQLRGIEVNERAAAVAELVLWIGWLQWHIRSRGNAAVAEPVVHDYGNIECRDAVLTWATCTPALDAQGHALTRWDGLTRKRHPVTAELVPDESAQVPQWHYAGARPADWPLADFIIGNPPFVGNKRMREALGDGYVETLRRVWPEVPDSADFVMFWWAKAASEVIAGRCERMGLITTNSITMVFNRRVVEAALQADTHLAFAIPDHPWVDSTDGAAVRIAMTVLTTGRSEGQRCHVTSETPADYGEVNVTVNAEVGVIHADLSVGANVMMAKPLKANHLIANRGVIPHGSGFTVTEIEAISLGLGTDPALEKHLRPYRNNKDLTDRPREIRVIDLFGLSREDVLRQFPKIYQWLLERVKPERDTNPRPKRRDFWWRFGEDQPRMRSSLAGLPRYIATGQVAKHRVFQFLDASILPDDKLIAIALADAFALGVLSSDVHIRWALAAGGKLGVGNDPVYSKTTCFDTFPFPDEDTGLTEALRARIAALAEQIDAHRKRVLAQPDVGAGLTLTKLYNVREALRAGQPLSDKDRAIHTAGLVGVLHSLHTELDTAVLHAYGWADLSAAPPAHATAELLQRLVALNAQRAAEEAQDRIRWLRPEFQNPQIPEFKPLIHEQVTLIEPAPEANSSDKNSEQNKSTPTTAHAWPSTLPEQIRAIADTLAASPSPLTLAQLAQGFKGKGAWKKSLPTLLQTLHALGRAHPVTTASGEEAWR